MNRTHPPFCGYLKAAILPQILLIGAKHMGMLSQVHFGDQKPLQLLRRIHQWLKMSQLKAVSEISISSEDHHPQFN